jgi:hypothetical protein
MSTKEQKTKQTPWPEYARELYRPSDRHLSAKLVPTFADRGCHAVSATDPYGRVLGFLDQSRYFFFQVAPQLYSQVRMDLAPDQLLLRSDRARNRTRTSGSIARNSDTHNIKMFLGSKVRPVHRADKLAAICEPII